MSNIIKGEYKIVDINTLKGDENNARTDLPDIEELASDIKANGLINPLTVVCASLKGEEYRVTAGHRRLAALKHLKVKSVPVIVLTDTKDVEVVQLAENIGRVNLHPLDLAQRLFDLCDPKGAYGKKFSMKELAEKLGKSTAHVENLVRVRKKLCDDVWTSARRSKYDASTRVLFAWAAMDEAGQKRAFKSWEAQQDKIALHGRKRGAGNDEGESEGGPRKRADGVDLSKKQVKFFEPQRDALAWKLEHAKGVGDKARLEGALEVLNFMLGESKRFALLSAADMKAWAKAEAEAEAETETENDGEGEGEES